MINISLQNYKAGKNFEKLFDLLHLLKTSFIRLEVLHLEEGFSQSETENGGVAGSGQWAIIVQ